MERGYGEIEYVREANGVGTVTLNNPAKINALSRNMIRELTAVFGDIEADEEIRAVVIRAAGKHFCAGHDLSEMVGHGVKENTAIFAACGRMMKLIHQVPQPVIAAVRGIATAAGCQLAAWCDLVVAADDAHFATPGVRLGLFCTTPMVAITRAIGRKAAMEMLMTGRQFPAVEACALGLVNRVVPTAELDSAAAALAAEIAAASRLTLAFGKRAFYAQVDQPEDKALDYATHTIALNLSSRDAQDGIQAFLDKTTVTWRHE
ncbi:MAG: enoyl-CoA hydratase [Deltaproteobacteria bacterium]|nr:enoyl-CoA hydratase [Candidatus Anaeroferrophillacea bacterium]